MPVRISPAADADALSIASSAVLAALMDTLRAKGLLSTADIHASLREAGQAVSLRTQNELRARAGRIITDLLASFPENNV